MTPKVVITPKVAVTPTAAELLKWLNPSSGHRVEVRLGARARALRHQTHLFAEATRQHYILLTGNDAKRG